MPTTTAGCSSNCITNATLILLYQQLFGFLI